MIEKLNYMIAVFLFFVTIAAFGCLYMFISTKIAYSFNDLAYIGFVVISSLVMFHKFYAYKKLKDIHNIDRKKFAIFYSLSFILYLSVCASPFIGKFGEVMLFISLISWLYTDRKLINIIKPLTYEQLKAQNKTK